MLAVMLLVSCDAFGVLDDGCDAVDVSVLPTNDQINIKNSLTIYKCTTDFPSDRHIFVERLVMFSAHQLIKCMHIQTSLYSHLHTFFCCGNSRF